MLARCLDAHVYENWTDVPGFLSADPRIIEHPRAIHRITFDEMRELSYMGASVLQEDAIFPVRESQYSYSDQEYQRSRCACTVIRETAEEREVEHLITGIAGRKDFTAVHIQKTHMSDKVGVVRAALSVFERHGVSIEHILREWIRSACREQCRCERFYLSDCG